MIVFEFIFELIGKIFVEIIFEGLIKGLFRLLSKGFDFVKYDIIGLKKTEKTKNPIIDLEKRLLYKTIELKEDFNSTFKKGQRGAVLEIIDKEKVYAEFYDQSGKQIEVDNMIVFEVRINQLRLEKLKKQHTTPGLNYAR